MQVTSGLTWPKQSENNTVKPKTPVNQKDDLPDGYTLEDRVQSCYPEGKAWVTHKRTKHVLRTPVKKGHQTKGGKAAWERSDI